MKSGFGKSRQVTTFMIGDWHVDPATVRVFRGNEEVKLEPKVMDVLAYMASRPGELITREDLEQNVWTGTIVGYDALSHTISKLREALQDDSRNPRYIQTIPKRGYRLVASVTAAEEPLAGTEPANNEFTGNRSVDEEASSSTRAGSGSLVTSFMSGKLIGLVSAVVLVLVAAYYYINVPDRQTAKAVTVPGDTPAIVVLPFINLSKDPAQEYFSDGITDDLIIELSGYANLRVVARRSAYLYKNRQKDMQGIARDLGADYVLDGSVRRDGKNIRVNVQLVNATDGSNIWAQQFNKEVTDLFKVQDEIRVSIVNALSIALTREEQAKERRYYTSSFEAYDLFLRGQSKLVTRASAADNREAQVLLEQATELDPSFARAHAALALSHADAFRFGWATDPERTRRTALELVQRAVSLDDQLPQAYWVLGYVQLFLYEQHDKAIKSARRSLELAPNNLDAQTVLAVTYVFGGEPRKARLLMEEQMHRNKHYSSQVPSIVGLASLVLGDNERALSAYNESLLINASRVQGLATKAVVLYRMGKEDEAEFQVYQLFAQHPDFRADVWAARQPFKDKSIGKRLQDDLEKVITKAGLSLPSGS